MIARTAPMARDRSPPPPALPCPPDAGAAGPRDESREREPRALPAFDPSRVAFSRRGSYLAFSVLGRWRPDGRDIEPGLYLRTLHGYSSADRRVFRLAIDAPGAARAGSRGVGERVVANPARLVMRAGAGALEAAFAGPERVLLRASGGAVLLEAPTGPFNYARPAGPGAWEFNLAAQRVQVVVRVRSGVGALDAPWREQACTRLRLRVEPGAGQRVEVELVEFVASLPPDPGAADFDACVRAVAREFGDWVRGTPEVPSALEEGRRLAAYVTWSCLVSPRGHLRRETMYMSKNWMSAVWSWDHCFNALALAEKRPELAWDQWFLMFDFQRADGSLPDVASDTEFVTAFVKPPVHGWFLGELLRRMRIGAGRRREALERLEAWTEWWMTQRDEDGDGLPQYNHGNDSGWDNASVFDQGMPVEGPDLATFLVLQMRTCARLADGLGQRSRAAAHRSRARGLTAALVRHSWRDGRFTAPRSGDHRCAGGGDSLVAFMPLLLGDGLPGEVRRRLLRNLRAPGRFITAHGVATESPASPLYRADGYWRGPVWAPSTLLIVRALQACGDAGTAARVARRFCETCARSGMAENFDALSGRGLRDRSYSWTASTFLVLGSELRRA